jgi:pimeloyl-ACP methyl ester carboxylesterase
MKKAFLLLCCIVILCSANAQTNNTVVKFTKNESPDNFYIDNSIGKIYGTLTLPKETRKVPVVLMIGGSGPTDRNMNQGQTLRTNSFLLLAKGLAENGIASLRYDKRGVGASTGAVNDKNLTLDDFINDANLLVSKLAVDDRFSEIIILGHSEGAAIGLMTSIMTVPAAFISFSGYENDMVTLIGQQLKPALNPKEYNLYTELADSLKAGKIVRRNLPASLAPMFTLSSQVFLSSTLKYDQRKEIQKLTIPVLVIGGSTDLQVPAKAAMRLAEMNKRATLKVIPEMNHVLKRAPADRRANLATYDQPTLPLHEDILPLITNFIKKHSTL